MTGLQLPRALLFSGSDAREKTPSSHPSRSTLIGLSATTVFSTPGIIDAQETARNRQLFHVVFVQNGLATDSWVELGAIFCIEHFRQCDDQLLPRRNHALQPTAAAGRFSQVRIADLYQSVSVGSVYRYNACTRSELLSTVFGVELCLMSWEHLVPDQITQNLAIWGAVTGTIGTLAGIVNLYFRYRRHRQDRAHLVCSSDLQYELISNEPSPRFNIIARSKGRRPITVDFIRYYLRPGGFWKALLASWNWRQGQWIYDQEERLQSITLDEGRKAEIKIQIPWKPPLHNIAKVSIFDETGKEWPVAWPSQAARKRLDKNEKLDEFSERKDGRWYELRGHIVGGEYRMVLRWHKTLDSDMEHYQRDLRFASAKKYQAKLESLKAEQLPKLMSGEIEKLS